MEYIAIKTNDIPDYDSSREYFVTNIIGDCMNHPDSPVMVGDGGNVIAHKIDRFEFMREWKRYTGHCILFHLSKWHPRSRPEDADGTWMIKELVRVDLGLFYVFRCYNPELYEFSIGVDEVFDACIVDCKI